MSDDKRSQEAVEVYKAMIESLQEDLSEAHRKNQELKGIIVRASLLLDEGIETV